jgi:hypothetical protein
LVIVRGQFIGLAGQAAAGKGFEFGAEHVGLRQFDVFTFGPTILAALDVEHGVIVQQVRGVPGAEVDFVMHQAFGTEYAHRENAG